MCEVTQVGEWIGELSRDVLVCVGFSVVVVLQFEVVWCAGISRVRVLGCGRLMCAGFTWVDVC